MNTLKRYNPVSVTLHWLTVVLMLAAGFLADDEGGGSSPINIHMILGALLLAVLVIRLVVRFTSKRPLWADTGNVLLNKLGELVHYALYLAVFFILGMGAWIAYNRNLFAYMVGTGSALRRVGFIGAIHQLGWVFALGLIIAHVGAALYHQFIIKDDLLNRMWYGRS